MASELYRIVHGETPKIEEFLPEGALGKIMKYPASDLAQHCWNNGVSVYDDFVSACEKSESLRYGPGKFIATLVIPEDPGFEIVQTGRNRHHYTIFANPESLFELVVGDSVRIPGAPDG